ncbi:C40 family peptidase [Macrococcus brunensis]|uniref:C40 family peptidase n=1 Tax=Macrococcus brunensis TaxID=198483 RepID=UPI001EEFC95C|nr:C40 family peptidase [Macrococcus brunensis]ULG72425.1 C40 family peptidase [Macrococcus brunensis]ULG74679.1 C40 family peptidase [Macrococcus brunensis]
MKKTVLTLTTLAGLATLGSHHADAAAYTIDEVNNGEAGSHAQATSSNQSYSYTYVINQDGSRTYNYSNGSSRTTSAQAPAVQAQAATTSVQAPAVAAPAANLDRVSYSNTTATAAPVAKKAATATTSVNNNVAAIANSMAANKTYVYGGNSATAVDCSSFAQQVLASMGKSIPRTTWAQMAAGTQVSTPQPGDLVFFNGGSHVGVYIGNGQMVDALNPSAGVGQRAVSYISGSITGYYRY